MKELSKEEGRRRQADEESTPSVMKAGERFKERDPAAWQAIK